MIDLKSLFRVGYSLYIVSSDNNITNRCFSSVYNSIVYECNACRFIYVVFFFLLLSCATQKNRPDSIRGITEISFGKSGGFTGMTEEYIITGKAEVLNIVNGERTRIKQLKKKYIRKISKKINEMQFSDLKLSERGNMTYFIEVKANKYKNRVSWSDLMDVPEVKELYIILAKSVTSD